MGHSLEVVKKLLSENFSKFIGFLVFQTFIQLLSIFAEVLGILPGTGADIWVQFLVGILTIWNFCYLVQVTNQLKHKKEVEFIDQVLDATYDSFTFLLYSLLYVLTIIVGLLFFILPAFYLLIFHYFAPFASILEPDVNKGDDSYLSFSRKIIKPYWGQVVGFFIITIVLNLLISVIVAIPFLSEVRIVLSVILSPVEAALLLVSDLLGISLFQHLCSKYRLNSENPL
jgi:hypothetical protein